MNRSSVRARAWRPGLRLVVAGLTASALLAAGGAARGATSPAAHSPRAAHIPRAELGPQAERHVIGNGSPTHCTSAAVVKAVAKAGLITFDCGPKPLTIVLHASAKVTNASHHVVIDGGGLITLSGNKRHRILYQDTCDSRQGITTSDCYDQKWPYLVVRHLTLEDGNSMVRQTANNLGGGGAIFDEGGRLKVIDTRFVDNRCYHVGPDLGGAAIRALGQFHNRPVYVTGDTFRGGRCSNGGALSSIGVSWVVTDSVMVDNRAIGHGANPASSGSPGGGSGGAIYTDGNRYTVTIKDTTMRHNHAREGGGAIFYVSDDNTGTLTIRGSTLLDNPNQGFYTPPYPGIFFKGKGHPKVVNSTIK